MKSRSADPSIAITHPDRHPMDADELADVQAQFDACDVDGDQRIDFREFSALLERLGCGLPHARRRRRFDAVDSNRDGSIDRSEFIDWLRTA